jgi:hypothetical protein
VSSAAATAEPRETTAEASEIREILRGAVDLYVHTNPELLRRRNNDIDMANELKADGFRAAMMWHQFSHTGERAALASAVTGFEMHGSIVLNGTVGGLNPVVTEYAIRMGARYVSMPTMSGSAYRARATDYGRVATEAAGPVPVVDEDGNAVPGVHEVLEVVAKHDVVFGFGYLGPAEAMGVLRAVKEHRIERVAVLRPYSFIGLRGDEVESIMALPGAVLQIPSSSLRAAETGNRGATPAAAARSGHNTEAPAMADAVKRFGAQRCLLMSDSGWNELTSLEWLTLGSETLLAHGVTPEELRTLVRDTPAQLIGVEN